jgi:hypothetical protein
VLYQLSYTHHGSPLTTENKCSGSLAGWITRDGRRVPVEFCAGRLSGYGSGGLPLPHQFVGSQPGAVFLC